jgi:hypothetical protein
MPSTKTSSEICIKPLGGLCNRMRVIDAAISLARVTNSDLHVIWVLNADLNCRFEDLWDIPPSIKKITEISISTHFDRFVEKLSRKKIGGFIQTIYFKYFLKSFDLVLTSDRMEAYELQNYVGCNFVEMVANKRVLMTTVHRFYDSVRPFQDFILIRDLQEIVDRQVVSFRNVIGVHIRRTDNQQSEQYSSTAKFIELMQAEVRQDNSTKFFIATDSPAEEAKLQEIFPDRIVTYKKQSLDRNNSVAIQDAAIDLYCLSKCRKLIGSYYSSFTDTARQIDRIDCIIAKD